MRKLLFFAIAAVGLYLGWVRFGPSRAPPRANNSGDTVPAANAQQRIDNLSGAAPPE